MDSLGAQTKLAPRDSSRPFDLRLAAAAILLLPALWFTWLTINGLAARRELRTDLAELTHVRYGLLSPDRWREIITPILNAQIDRLDLKGQTKNLRPTVQRALTTLLENIKQQITAPSAKSPSGGPAVPALGNPLLAGMVSTIIASLQPHIPEYTNVVMAELAKSENQAALKESIRGFLMETVKKTFSTVDMTTYASILKRYGCPSG